MQRNLRTSPYKLRVLFRTDLSLLGFLNWLFTSHNQQMITIAVAINLVHLARLLKQIVISNKFN